MFKWIGKKTGSGAVDGAIARLGQRLVSIDWEKFKIISKHLTPEQEAEFHKNIALLVFYGVKMAAGAASKDGAKVEF